MLNRFFYWFISIFEARIVHEATYITYMKFMGTKPEYLSLELFYYQCDKFKECESWVQKAKHLIGATVTRDFFSLWLDLPLQSEMDRAISEMALEIGLPKLAMEYGYGVVSTEDTVGEYE